MKQILFITEFLITVSFLTIFGCKKEEELRCETLENLIGNWHYSANAETYTFTTNNEFIDSIFTGQINDTLDCIIKGRFNLINGFLELSDLKYTYLQDLSGIKLFKYRYPTYKFEIIDDKLIMEEVGIFHPQGHSGVEIYGKWQSNRIIIAYDTEQSPNFISGNQIIEFEFNKDTNLYSINYFNHYGVSQDSNINGPFMYRFDSPYVYCQICDEYFGRLDSGILITSENGIRTFTKIK